MMIFYRLSDGSYPKVRFKYATKDKCLINFINRFEFEPMYLYLDNVKDETFERIRKLAFSERTMYGMEKDTHIIRTNAGSSAGSFKLVFEEALKQADTEMIYFVEDDYWHLDNACAILLEGLEIADYISLYDHKDKYIPAAKGGNKFIGEDGAEQTKVAITKSRHWKLTNSTTMTFATRVSTLKDDAEIWQKHITGTYPRDFDCFIELRHKGKSLITPIPSLSTHCEPMWAAPLIDWEKIIR